MTEQYDAPTDKGHKLNWRQASHILGCGKTHFYDLVHTGQLPAYRAGDGRRGIWVWEADCRKLVKRVNEEPFSKRHESIKKIDACEEESRIAP